MLAAAAVLGIVIALIAVLKLLFWAVDQADA